jgi:hypothetical protein
VQSKNNSSSQYARAATKKKIQIHHEGREDHEGKKSVWPKRDKEKYFFVTFVRFVVKCPAECKRQ